jgi:hypothetical protein
MAFPEIRIGNSTQVEGMEVGISVKIENNKDIPWLPDRRACHHQGSDEARGTLSLCPVVNVRENLTTRNKIP